MTIIQPLGRCPAPKILRLVKHRRMRRLDSFSHWFFDLSASLDFYTAACVYPVADGHLDETKDDKLAELGKTQTSRSLPLVPLITNVAQPKHLGCTKSSEARVYMIELLPVRKV